MTERASKIKRVRVLEAEATKLRREAFLERPLPNKWELGQRVRFIRDIDFEPTKGSILTIVKVEDTYENRRKRLPTIKSFGPVLPAFRG